jgi:YD repeat-containing protein
VTTTLPAVSAAENGTGVSTTTEEHFDEQGYRTKSVDGVGTVTTYEYDEAKGGMIEMVQDQGTGKLELKTEYELDWRGRTTRELGPVHSVDLGEVPNPTSIRSASWTYYKDRIGERWSFQGYRKEALSSNPISYHVVGAVKVIRTNVSATRPTGLTSYRMDEEVSAVYSGSGLPSETASFDATFPRSSWESWDLSFTDTSQEMKQTFSYWDIPSTGYGTLDVDYGRRLYGYDASGRQNQTTCAGNTTDKTTFNAMGWAIQEELGIVENSSSSSSSSSSPSGSLLTVTTLREYDDDGNLTKETLPVDTTTANDRVTDYRYDFRNRQIETETTVEKDGGGTWTLIQKNAYDNRGLVESVTAYHTSVATSNRTGYQTMSHDALGRTYQSSVYEVDNSSGATSNPQVSKTWYDANNRTVKSLPAGSKLFTATTYDAIGRTEVSYQAYEEASSSSSSSSSSNSDPASVANAIVMEQYEPAYDAASNVISTTVRQRYDDTSGLGALGDSGSGTKKARVSYTASYPDALGRTQASVDYGTYDNGTWTRSETIPSRSDDDLVTSMTYDPMSRVIVITDPVGIHTNSTFDQAGRLIKVVENAPGSGSSSSSSSSGSGGVDVRTTHYEYTSDSWLRKLKSDNADTGQQVTEWIYGVSPAKGSDLYSNRLVYQKVYPDSSESSSSSSSGSTIDRVTSTFNRQQQVTSLTDQLGTKHLYSYDNLGRILADDVDTFGSGVDRHVGKIETAYDNRGRATRKTSYHENGTTVRNEVAWDYNGFNQMVSEYQEHSGEVNRSTSLKVDYSYASGAQNTIRPTGMTYPNVDGSSATTIETAYTSQMADALSRFDEIKDGSLILSSFKYVGLGMTVAQKYDAAADTELTYGSSSNKYDGYDRFGRVARTLWKEGANTLVESKYGHNRVGGVTWRKDVEAHKQSVTTQDNHYWYDGLQQVKQHERGELTPTGGPPYTGITPATRKQQEIFHFDETGNWLKDFSQDPSLNQDRTHNKANEITSITPTSGSGAVVQPVYDKAGNMTKMPKPTDWESGYDCTWDAWNRLVALKDGGATVGAYRYDGLSRRVEENFSSGVRSFYYNNQWRVIEDRNPGGDETRDYVYNPADRWNLIRRRWSQSSSLDKTQFVLRDFLDPVAVVDEFGIVEERYGYDAFGPVRFMAPDFGDRTMNSPWKSQSQS